MGRVGLVFGLAVAATVPALGLRLSGAPVPAPAQALLFGLAILGAGFLLSWAAEAAERHISPGLTLALLALVTVLPEYAVDLYFAYQAGRDPGSKYVHFAAANMTGSNRLLIGVAWPLAVLVFWWRGGRRAVPLRWANAPEVAFLAAATAYSFVITLKGRIDLFDMAILLGLFAAYLWRVSRLPEEEGEGEKVVGPAAELARLPHARQHAAIVAMIAFAALAILAAAKPFAESLVAVGRGWGVNEFLLIQWLAPLASEAPAVVVALLFCWRLRPAVGLGSLVSDKINQWTLLVGMLPLVFSIGAGRAGALPLDARQREEFFLTAAQSAFALALLLRLRLSLGGGLALLGLFAVQLVLAFTFRQDEARSIRVLTVMAWVYLALAAGLIAWRGRALLDILRVGLFNRPPPAAALGGEATAASDAGGPGGGREGSSEAGGRT